MDRELRLTRIQKRLRDLVHAQRQAQDSSAVTPGLLPFASIVVLNFNGKEIIGRCLDHLLAQNYPLFEIIVVDNASTDGSRALLHEYADKYSLIVVESPLNLGVAGGRNLGFTRARGEIVAFVDNDGYADKDWLRESTATLLRTSDAGAVSSLVFFRQAPQILNGAGGTMNLQGYAGDICCQVPYEFADIPHEVLYPMGCGMVLSRQALEQIGPLDDIPVKWFDDTELGIRLWKKGFRVLVCPYAFVDHDFHTSDKLLSHSNWRTAFFFERARIRNVLKYFRFSALRAWAAEEFVLQVSLLCRGQAPHVLVLWLSYAWNLLHLRSALAVRRRFSRCNGDFSATLHNSWGTFPPPSPPNDRFYPQLNDPTSSLTLGSDSDSSQLFFGWHEAESDGPHSFRWTDRQASLVFGLKQHSSSMHLVVRSATESNQARIIIRRLGELSLLFDAPIALNAQIWEAISLDITLSPNLYEVLFISTQTATDSLGRTLGLAVSKVEIHQIDDPEKI